MKKLFFWLIRLSGIAKFTRFFYQRKNITVLVFHNPSPVSFAQALKYLQRKYNIIFLSEFLASIENDDFSAIPAYSLIITFDDGHKGNFDLLPIISQYKAPVTIFLAAGIVGTNRQFWFSQIDKFDESAHLKNIPNKERIKFLEINGFEETKEHSSAQALSEQQIIKMAPFVDFQSHTMLHPILPMCTDEESLFEISESKKQLESKYGFKIHSLAYPNGDYSEREINFCKKTGYLAAFTTEGGFNNRYSHPFRLKRIGTNDTENMNEFILRVSGVWFMFKQFTSWLRKKNG